MMMYIFWLKNSKVNILIHFLIFSIITFDKSSLFETAGACLINLRLSLKGNSLWLSLLESIWAPKDFETIGLGFESVSELLFKAIFSIFFSTGGFVST